MSRQTVSVLRLPAAIMGALRLYLDFINLFMMLMQRLGTRRA
jgi:FtsH-binding integral membrane protein